MNKITKKDLRIFAFILGFACLIIGGRLFFKWHQSKFLFLVTLGTFFIASGIINPFILVPVYKIWMKIGHILGWVNTRVLLTLFFYLIVSPMGLFLRLIRKDLLNLKIDKNKDSYWIKRDHKALGIGQYEKQF